MTGTYLRFWRNSRLYRRNYGIIRGMGLAIEIRRIAKNQTHEPQKLKIPFHAHPIYIRPSTVDSRVAAEVFGEMPFRESVPEDVRLIIDAGAHIGLQTVYFAHRFPKAMIIAIEPEYGNFQMLLRNTAGYPNVRAVHAALWSDNEMLRISNPRAASWAFNVDNQIQGARDETGMIAGVTVGEILKDSGFDKIDFFKIDIEGSEFEVFRSSGCSSWIDAVDTFAIEFHDWLRVGCEAGFEAAIRNMGLSKRQIGDYCIYSRALEKRKGN